MLAILVIAPLIVSSILALLLIRHGTIVKYVSLIGSLGSLAFIYAVSQNAVSAQSMHWFSIGSLTVNIATYTYPLNMLLLWLVGIITPLIFSYSIGFMERNSEQGRFFFEMGLFASGMMLFAIAGSLITMFIGWELLGITSYLLIGFWYAKSDAAPAARKAITIVLFGDILMLIAIVMIWNSYHTFSIGQIVSNPSNALYIPLLLIMVAAFTKSAQFPFHEWLPAAMAGPTPVSAFLHSSTMVKAGVFLIASLFTLYMDAHLLPVILIVGLISAAFGASNAAAERHIKKILAYSTIEDLGLMFVALGLGAFTAAVLLFIVQAFYKALLFMDAGALMRTNSENYDIFRIYGARMKKTLLVATLFGVVSIAGIFPLGGFFAKASIGSAAASTNLIAYMVLLAIELVTGFYIFRWYIIPMRSPPQSDTTRMRNSYKLLPKSMIAPSIILSALTAASALAYYYLPIILTQSPYVPGYVFGAYTGAAPTIGIADAAAETAFIAIGAYAAYLLYSRRRAPALYTHRLLSRAVYNAPLVNRAYSAFAAAFAAIGSGIYWFDSVLYSIFRAVALSAIEMGAVLRRMVNGQTSTYLLAFALGVVIIIMLYVK